MEEMTFHLAGELPLKGRRRGRGWMYGGADSRQFTEQKTREMLDYFSQNNYPNMVTAARIFLRTCGREGYISAINTWDGQILTWGVGFAYGKINRLLWPSLGDEVRNELMFLMPSRFTADGVHVDQSIRRDRDALASLIQVSETAPFNDAVFRAMFTGFTKSTLGIETDNIPTGQHYILSEPSLVYFASRLAHWLPAGYRMKRDLARSVELAAMPGDDESIDASQFVAASIRVFAQNFLRSDKYGETRAGNRRVLKEAVGDRFNMIAKWQNRMNQFIRQDSPFTITPHIGALVPAFTQATMPFFSIHDNWREIPEGHLILSERKEGVSQYIDIGPA